MEEVILAVEHGVLVVAELGQGAFHEGFQRPLRVTAGGRKPEIVQIAEAVVEAPFDQIDDRAGDQIGRELHRIGRIEVVRRWLAVVGVIVPLAAGRLIILHEIARCLAHLAVKVLHAQDLAVFGPACERLARTKKARVLAQLDLDIEARLPVLDHRQHAVLTRPGDDHALGLVPLQRACQFAAEAVRVVIVIELDIVDREAVTA